MCCCQGRCRETNDTSPFPRYSWGLGYANLTVACPAQLPPDVDIGAINAVPLDPTNEFTYTVVESILGELADLFPDQYLHVGGDELIYPCWNNSAAIREYMEQQGLNLTGLQAHFETRLFGMLQRLSRQPIVWADTFEEIGYMLPAGTIVELWNDDVLVGQALDSGMRVLMANGWYLDRQVGKKERKIKKAKEERRR